MIRFLVNGLVFLSSIAILAATVGWLYLERQWSAWEPPTGPLAEVGYDAFTYGSFGLEAMPLKYAAVIDKVSAAAFATGLEDGRTPWQAYGFLDNPRAGEDDAPICAANAAQKLPYGFAVTNSVPESAIQTPLKFAALTCATCHSGAFRGADGSVSGIVSGMGNQELDVIAFTDAVRNAVTDPELTAEKILDAYGEQCPDDQTGLIDGFVEGIILSQWLSGIRSAIGGDFAKYGMPYHGADKKNAKYIPAGPGRTRPFRSVVRVAVDLPGVENYAYSKVPVVFEQRTDLRPRSQYDGSIKSPVTRSYIAAYTSGSSILSLSKPQVSHAIRAAAKYTEELGLSIPVAEFKDIFPGKGPDQAAVAAGFEVYMSHCADCHGYRPLDGGTWVAEGAYLHQFENLDPARGPNRLGIDDKRVTFRYAKKLPLPLWTALPGRGEVADAQAAALADQQTRAVSPAFAYFWQQLGEKFQRDRRVYRSGHPLYFPECDEGNPECRPEDLLANAPFCTDGDDPMNCAITAEVAMFNNPIPRAFMRAPYLHNGSIPTMRQLINLDPRPARFCRGENVYDPDAMGYVAPEVPVGGGCDNPRLPFLFDTKLPGNSAAGHDFPWAFDALDDAKRQDLEALMAYLKTL